MKKDKKRDRRMQKSTVVVLLIVLAIVNTSCAHHADTTYLSGEMAPPHPLKVSDAKTKGITLHEAGDAVNVNRLSSIQRFGRSKATTPTGVNNVLVILVQFPNGGSTYTGAPNGAITNNVAYFQGLVSSARSYFNTVSYNQLTVNFTVDPTIYTLTNTMDYYGAPAGGLTSGDAWAANQLGGGIGWLIWNAIDAADSNNNYAAYDSIMIYHAGAGEESDVLNNSANDIWSARWSGFAKATADGVTITAAIIVPETEIQDGFNFSSLGVTCHEYGHELGLPDLYDTKPVPTSEGIGSWGLMGSGNWNGPGQNGSSPAHPCAWSKVHLGWVTPILLIASQKGILLPQAETNPVAFRVNVGLNEYFLIENRQAVNYDQYLPGCGLLIWHIDDTVKTTDYDGDGISNWADNQLQWNAFRKFVDLEEADGWGHMDARVNRGDANDPYFAGNPQMSPPPNEFTPTSDGSGPGDAQGVTGPDTDSNTGAATQISVTIITPCGSVMFFDLSVPVLVLPSQQPRSVPNFNQQIRPLSRTHIKEAEDLVLVVQKKIDEKKAEGKDTKEAENLLNQAKEALEKAYTYFAEGNYIAANTWASRALQLLAKCMEILKNL